MNEKEKKWLKEGIEWTPEKITFIRRNNELLCVRIQTTPVRIDPVEFIKKLGVVEDGISQEDLNKAFDKAFKDD